MPADNDAMAALPPIIELEEVLYEGEVTRSIDDPTPTEETHEEEDISQRQSDTEELGQRHGKQQERAVDGSDPDHLRERSAEQSQPDEREPGTDSEQEGPSAQELAAKAEAFDGWAKALTTNPVGQILNLIETAVTDPVQKAQILAHLGGQAAPAEAATQWQKPEDCTPEELFIQKNAQAIQSLPTLQQQAAQAMQAVSQYAPYLEGLAYQNAVLEAKLEAMLAASALTLPDVDEAAVRRLVQSGKTYSQAVKSTFGQSVQKAAAIREKAKAPVPTTPGNSASDRATPPESKADAPALGSNDSFVKLWKEVRASTR